MMTNIEFKDIGVSLQPIHSAMPIWRGVVTAEGYRKLCEQVHKEGGRLMALWGCDERPRGGYFTVHAALAGHPGLYALKLPLEAVQDSFPDISDLFPAANRMQRAVADMLGIHAAGADDQRKWLRHGGWREGSYPLRKDFDGQYFSPTVTDAYPFVQVEGDGVHEIPVGPVHAGTIEPGHFRFSIIGERVLRLEERMGYKHKGIEKRFESLTPKEGVKLAGRVSGDSTVAYAWAYTMALESLSEFTPPPRAVWLRALFLELERIHNHLGDLGYLGNDVALAFGFAQFWRLKEDALRLNQELFGHRYLMDKIVPGGVASDIDQRGGMRLREGLAAIESEVKVLKEIYDEHAGVQDRFLTTGRVTPALAAKLGLTGMPGRASGQAWDLRAQYPCAPYDQLDVRMATHRGGDVAARVTVRFEEVYESIRLINLILDRMPPGELRFDVPAAPDNAFAIGWVEGWRGEILVALHSGANDSLYRVHPHDPSWQNWPVLEHAIIGNIVPDFPLINKSFNLSYTGADL